MSTLYLDRKNLALKLEGQTLVLVEEDERRGTVPLKMLEKVVVRGNIGLESRLLGALAAHQVDVLFLSGRGSHARCMSFSHHHNDVRRRLAQFKVHSDAALRRDLACRLVLAKLSRQTQLLTDALSARPDLRKPLRDSLATLETIRANIGQTPADALSLAQLRGYEGAAAASYFSAYTRLFAPALQFNQRRKRPPPDPVNACLSLGYTLLHFDAVAVCHIAGLEPLLGFYHDPAFGRDSLACDLIEPLRPRLDSLVWSLFRDKALRAEHFSSDDHACLLNKAGRQRFYARYEVFARPVRRLLRLQAHRLARQFCQLDNGVLT